MILNKPDYCNMKPGELKFCGSGRRKTGYLCDPETFYHLLSRIYDVVSVSSFGLCYDAVSSYAKSAEY
jgi:hypothetical protein